jgi:hypothetical protein
MLSKVNVKITEVKMLMVAGAGLGHVPRPRNFTIENIVFIGRFTCELPLAILTSDL